MQPKKYQLIEWISSIPDTKLINKLERIAEESDWWDEISEPEKNSIALELKDLEEGRCVDHSVAKRLYEKYL